MATKAKRHVHKYAKLELSGTEVWACALPDCYHYMPKHMEKMVIGKASICWECEDTFILNLANMKLQKPICNDCSITIPSLEFPPSKSSEAKLLETNEDIANFLGIEIPKR